MIAVGVLSMLSGFFGCVGRKGCSLADSRFETAESEILKSVCITSNTMDYSGNYMFSIDKAESTWFLSCDAVIDDNRICIGENVLQIGEDDAEQILAVVRERKLVERVAQYEKPDDRTFALDEATCGISFEFADGRRIYAPIDLGGELTDAFRRLVRKYK